LSYARIPFIASAPGKLGESPHDSKGDCNPTEILTVFRKARHFVAVAAGAFSGFRKSTRALSSGVRNRSGFRICTFTCKVPFCRLASGAISAT